MSVRAGVRAKKLPRPAPPSQPRVWEAEVDGVGTVYTHGAITRRGVRTYLIRISTPGLNERPVCEMAPDGSVVRWFPAGEQNADILGALAGAKKFVLAHSVMES